MESAREDAFKFLNAEVTDYIKDFVETEPGLKFLDGFPEIKVVIRADALSKPYDKVAVISGSESSHQPAYVGFVGDGMLTAAICGDFLASPPVDSILANDREDRLNFRSAAVIAESEDYEIKMVIIGDDCDSPPELGINERRGLAGTILVQKVAGAAAASGLSLVDVLAEANRASELVGTMGATLRMAQALPDRLGPGSMEVGLGTRGEPGAAVPNAQSLDSVISDVLTRILSTEKNYVPIKRGNSVVLMINGFGGLSIMELMAVAGKAGPMLLLEHGLAVARVYTGEFMISVQKGFSISIMKVDSAILKRLDAATTAPCWPGGDGEGMLTAAIAMPSRPKQLNHQGYILEVAIEGATQAIIDRKNDLNQLGDEYYGSTMCGVAQAISRDMKKYYPLNDAAETVKEIGSSIRRVMGGTFGIIYDKFCSAAYEVLKDNSHSDITPNHWADAFEAAVNAVIEYIGASAGYRSLLDALVPACLVLKEELSAGKPPVEAFFLSSLAASKGADLTQFMHPQTYTPGEEGDLVTDPGAMAAATWYKAAALAVKGASS